MMSGLPTDSGHGDRDDLLHLRAKSSHLDFRP